MNKASQNNLLDRIDSPSDLRQLKQAQLPQLAQEIRDYLINTISATGGHLGAGLGVVELTTALHYVFETPRDKLIWDVSHQCYPHKIITGRRERMRSLRQGGGLSGFTSRKESVYDPFGAVLLRPPLRRLLCGSSATPSAGLLNPSAPPCAFLGRGREGAEERARQREVRRRRLRAA